MDDLCRGPDCSGFTWTVLPTRGAEEPRSKPAAYSGLFGPIEEVFAQAPEARAATGPVAKS